LRDVARFDDELAMNGQVVFGYPDSIIPDIRSRGVGGRRRRSELAFGAFSPAS